MSIFTTYDLNFLTNEESDMYCEYTSAEELFDDVIKRDDGALFQKLLRLFIPQLRKFHGDAKSRYMCHAHFYDETAPSYYLTQIAKYEVDRCFKLFQTEFYASDSLLELNTLVNVIKTTIFFLRRFSPEHVNTLGKYATALYADCVKCNQPCHQKSASKEKFLRLCSKHGWELTR